MRSEKFNVLAISFLAFIGCMAPASAGVVTFPSIFGSPQSSNFQSPAIGVAGTPRIVTITLNPNGQTITAGRLVNISFSGPNAPDFAIVSGGTCVPGTTILSPITTTTGQSCTLNIRYTPSTNAAGATGVVAALVGAIGALVPVPVLDPWMTTALALLMLAMGTFVAMKRSPRRDGSRGGRR